MPDMNENAETQQEYFGTNTPEPFSLEEKIVFSMVHSTTFDVEQLPECLQEKANEYAKSYCPMRRYVAQDLSIAWLAGFAFCLGGKVTVNREHNEKLARAIRGVIYIVKNCPKNELALARAIAEVEDLLNAK